MFGTETLFSANTFQQSQLTSSVRSDDCILRRSLRRLRLPWALVAVDGIRSIAAPRPFVRTVVVTRTSPLVDPFANVACAETGRDEEGALPFFRRTGLTSWKKANH